MAKVLVTGAAGFVGRALCRALLQTGHPVRAAVRERPAERVHATALETTVVGDIGQRAQSAWAPFLEDISTVVHLAARAHVLREQCPDALAEYRRVNVNGLAELARAAGKARVGRFIYVSSIGVHGRTNSRPFSEDDPLRPQDPYAVSKMEAEQALRVIASDTGMEFTIIRPPLVYGPGVIGNFRRLLEWVESGWPLPFGAVENRRSFVGLDNLVSLLKLCVDHPAAAGEVLLVADGEDLSTAALVKRLAFALGIKPRLISVPPALLAAAARLAGRSEVYARLCGSLMVDSRKARRVLDWSPVASVDQGLESTARWYLENRRH